MPKAVEPKVFLIGETTQVTEGVQEFLAAIGVPPGWTTDAASDAEALTEIAGKSCYLAFSKELNQNLTRTGTRNNHAYIQEQIIGYRHGSVLEHTVCNFALVDVSRVLTHELVRHRPGCAFSQVSGRYVRTDEVKYYLPKAIAQNVEAAGIFHDAFWSMEQWAKNLALVFKIDEEKNFGVKKMLTSAFRRLIGNGQTNHIIFSANHRALRHIIEMRTSAGAEEEIRLVFSKVFEICHDRYKAIYDDYVLKIVDGIPEITFPVGRV